MTTSRNKVPITGGKRKYSTVAHLAREEEQRSACQRQRRKKTNSPYSDSKAAVHKAIPLLSQSLLAILQVLFIRSVQDIVLFIGHEAVIRSVPLILSSAGGQRFSLRGLLLSSDRLSLKLCVHAGVRRLLVKLGEDHGAARLGVLVLLGLLDRSRWQSLGRGHSHTDVTPETVTKLESFRSSQAPVGDDLASASRSAEEHGEGELVARGKRGIADC